MAGQPARYKAYVDWNADGDFTDPLEDVTSDVLDGRTPVTMQYGRDQARALSPIAVGQAAFALDNQSRVYSPENTSSALNGQVVPGRSVMVTGTVGVTTYTLLRATIDDFKLQPDRSERYISVTCIDPLGQLRGVQVTTPLYQGVRPGEAIGYILDAVGWPAALRDLDLGATVMPFWWLDGDDAFQAVLDILDSEGPPALVTVDTSGRIVFRSRHHRLLLSASTTAQSTWRSSGSLEPLISSPAEYNHGFKEIVNSVTFDVPQRAVSGTLTAVWSSQGLTSVSAGETLEITAQGNSPFIGAEIPLDGVDFTTVSGTVSMSLSRDSGGSTLISVVGVGGSATIADLQLRAFAVSTVNTVRVAATDPSSVAKYGPRSLPSGRDPKWPSLGDARAIAQVILGQRAERLPTMTVTMVSANTTRVTQQLTRNLSDRVHITESHTGMDSDMFVEQIGHAITQGGAEHKTTFGLEKCPAQITGVFILGSATSGVLGTNKLGKRGLATSSTMFILGTSVLGTGVLAP